MVQSLQHLNHASDPKWYLNQSQPRPSSGSGKRPMSPSAVSNTKEAPITAAVLEILTGLLYARVGLGAAIFRGDCFSASGRIGGQPAASIVGGGCDKSMHARDLVLTGILILGFDVVLFFAIIPFRSSGGISETDSALESVVIINSRENSLP